MSDLERLALGAAIVLALMALAGLWMLQRQTHAIAKLVAGLRADVTDLHRGRLKDAANLNLLWAWAHGANPEALPSPLLEPDAEQLAEEHWLDVAHAATDPATIARARSVAAPPPPPWVPREDLPDPPDRRTRERRTTPREPDRRTTGAHRPADETTEMPVNPLRGP